MCETALGAWLRVWWAWQRIGGLGTTEGGVRGLEGQSGRQHRTMGLGLGSMWEAYSGRGKGTGKVALLSDLPVDGIFETNI